ncbi:hypothetical protein [Nocardioides sp. HB32]
MTEQGPRDHWDTFKSWHGQESLYREIYARTVATLAAALVIYLVAAMAGLVDREPATLVAAVALIPGVLMLIFSVPGLVKHWKLVRPLFVVWNDDESPEMQHAKRLYNRFTWGWIFTVAPGFILAALVFGA